MNTFEYLDEMKKIIMEQKEKAVKEGNKPMTAEEHFDQMYNMLYIIEKEMANAEYVYEAKGVLHEDYITFGEHTVLQKRLTDSLLIFQPMVSDIEALDMEGIAGVLSDLHEAGRIPEDIILLPPDINILRARLRKPEDKPHEE